MVIALNYKLNKDNKEQSHEIMMKFLLFLIKGLKDSFW